MLLEIALLQKFILFLGYPTRALSVTLFSLLLSSGIGSLVSGRALESRLSRNIVLACLSIILIVVSYAVFLDSLFAILLPQDNLIRIFIAFILLFPLGFVMGIPFPTGLRILTASSDHSVSWMWGINGQMSVLGSILATTVGILYGFNYALIFTASAYFIASLCTWRWHKNRFTQTFTDK